MSDHDTSQTPDEQGAAKLAAQPHEPRVYLRRITFEDSTIERDTDYPVHVTRRVLFDGQEFAGLANLRLGWTIEGGSTEGTVVGLYVDAEQAEPVRIVPGEGGQRGVTGGTIAGMRCLTPQGRNWETLHLADPHDREHAHVSGKAEWMHVWLFVREVEVIAKRMRVGDHVEDGGIPGTLVTCEQCSGQGLLHQPDAGAHPVSPEPQA